MLVFILPGFSSKNKVWADETRVAVEPNFPVVAVDWAHWQTGQTELDWIEKEATKVVYLADNKQINILAKSIGTAIAAQIVKQKPCLVNKLMLCGLPTSDLKPGDEKYYESLRTFPEDKFICIQNKEDNHGNFAEAEKFLHTLNPALKIVSRPRSDHEYPYHEDFADFFKDNVIG